ncbi:MAG: sugar phosphate isomerase/epimerase [Chloroflexota bacterium]|nr:sugar phosphate isomerase/epimerase [Chloroflexota bacterium]
MWTLTGFADEISDDLETQLDTLGAEGIRHLELRAVWGKNVLKLSDDELAKVKQRLAQAGVGVSSIGSPIGKIPVTDPFEPHLRSFMRALHVAGMMGAPYVRLFSFFIPEGKDPAAYRDEVLKRMGRLADAARPYGVTLLHENEKHIYGDVPERCLDILQSVGSSNLRAAWDPANFVQCGVRPHTQGYEMLRPYIEYVHVKDSIMETGQVLPAGQGDGEVRETLRALKDSGFDGYFSLEPHLSSSGPFSGFSGPDLYRKAVQAFKGLLKEQEIQWV